MDDFAPNLAKAMMLAAKLRYGALLPTIYPNTKAMLEAVKPTFGTFDGVMVVNACMDLSYQMFQLELEIEQSL